MAIGNLSLTYILALLVHMFFEMPTASLICARDSTAVKVEDAPKFNKPSTYAISSGRNGDMEMSKSEKVGSRM